MDTKDSGTNKTRRRLIQGSLAAPAVLTVSSASAASVSSFGRCLVNQKQQPTAFFIEESKLSTDNWLRKDVPVSQWKLKGQNPVWFYWDPGRREFVRLSEPLANGLNLWDMKKAGWESTGATSRRWALVWVDSDNGARYRVMQVMQPSGYQATTKSCYTSLIKA
ncbi:MAG: hypothetical protein U5L03_15075 [Burkholderiaceae bacterium]|nr:hypothetical protein [Burkholderiaceae bacterium]